MAEKKRQDELLERQRKIRQLKATGIQEKHLLEWNFAVAEDNKDIQMAKRYVEQWKKVKAEKLSVPDTIWTSFRQIWQLTARTQRHC